MTMTTPKARFKAWLENEQKTDEMIAFAEIPVILSKLGKNLAVIGMKSVCCMNGLNVSELTLSAI